MFRGGSLGSASQDGARRDVALRFPVYRPRVCVMLGLPRASLATNQVYLTWSLMLRANATIMDCFPPPPPSPPSLSQRPLRETPSRNQSAGSLEGRLGPGPPAFRSPPSHNTGDWRWLGAGVCDGQSVYKARQALTDLIHTGRRVGPWEITSTRRRLGDPSGGRAFSMLLTFV